jgi:hypothetical protein
MLPPPLDMSEVPRSGDIGSWEDALLKHYRSQAVNKVNGHTQTESFEVTIIRRYKELERAEHEYLVVEVPVDSVTRYLKIHRVANPPPKDTTERSSPHSTPSSSSQSSLGISKNMPAEDKVQAIDGWPTRDVGIIEELKFEKPSINLLDIAVVAKSVRIHNDQYKAFGCQCYWFSDVISAVLQKNFPHVVRQDGSQSGALHKKCGTYGLMQVYSRKESDVERVHETFKARKAQIQSLVCLLDNGCISAD